MLIVKDLRIRHKGEPWLGPLHWRVAAGEVLTLMGASGVGKSTLLSWLVGAPAAAFQFSGELWLEGQRLDGLPTAQRHIGILFQDDLLFPHLSVGGNLAFALPASIQGKAQRRAVIEQALTDADLAGFYERDPATLSGGQRSRVSVLRALLAEPQALLLDEPFARLDVDLRAQFRQFVYERLAALHIPAVLVTHDAADVPPAGEVLQLARGNA